MQIREWFVLEVIDSTSTLRSEGTSGAAVTSNLDLSGVPVQIKAFISVAKNQPVQLRVQALGDLMNSRGEALAVSDISWDAFGEGFLSGVLSRNESEIMAQWVGSGYHQGTICYRSSKDKKPNDGFSQKIVYSLAAM